MLKTLDNTKFTCNIRIYMVIHKYIVGDICCNSHNYLKSSFYKYKWLSVCSEYMYGFVQTSNNTQVKSPVTPKHYMYW